VVPNSMPGQDITITATYIVNVYTLSFEDWDGTVIFEDDIEFGQDLSSLAYPSDPTRNGYTFTGWDSSIPATMPANDFVITAEYNVNIHVLEFVDYNGDLIQSSNYGYGTNLNIVNTPSDPARVGYTFTGWDTLVPETMILQSQLNTQLINIQLVLLVMVDLQYHQSYRIMILLLMNQLNLQNLVIHLMDGIVMLD